MDIHYHHQNIPSQPLPEENNSLTQCFACTHMCTFFFLQFMSSYWSAGLGGAFGFVRGYEACTCAGVKELGRICCLIEAWIHSFLFSELEACATRAPFSVPEISAALRCSMAEFPVFVDTTECESNWIGLDFNVVNFPIRSFIAPDTNTGVFSFAF